MSEVLQANIFFFITSIAVIAFSLLACVVLYHVLKIVRSIRRIVERVEEGSEVLAEDMHHLRNYFAEGSLFSHIIGAFFRGVGGSDGAARKKRKSGKLNVKDED